jgi:two-component system NarL family response regulator
MEPIRIVVADHHAVVRTGLVGILHSDHRFSVVAEAANGTEAIDCYRRHHPDLLVMDLRMPQTDGIQATEAIRRIDDRARIMIFSAADGDEDVLRCLRAGATGYVLKDAAPQELIAAALSTHRGIRYLSPMLAEKMIGHVHGVPLSRRELDVLQLVAAGLSNKGVSSRAGISEGTVKFHVNRILAKLNCSTRTEAVTSAIRRGLIEIPGE